MKKPPQNTNVTYSVDQVIAAILRMTPRPKQELTAGESPPHPRVARTTTRPEKREMDKKQMVALTDSITAEVASKLNVEEAEARTLLGITMKKNREAIVAAIVTPTLSLVNPVS